MSDLNAAAGDFAARPGIPRHACPGSTAGAVPT